ncbi:Uncharacterized protein FWK35_00035132, partial [Aphis craccivora]
AYKTSGPSQCFACQGFGHSSAHCKHQPKCVKCGNDHATKSCTKTPDQPPKCCNCNGEHTANYRQCPAFIKATIAKKTNSTIPLPQPTPQVPTTISQAKQSTYAQALSPSNHHLAPVQPPNKINKKIPFCWQYRPSCLSSIKMDEQLKILYWNCQGLGNKKSELLQFIQHHKIHVILLNETHLKSTSLLKLPNYHIYRNDRPTPPGQSGAGGTAILIANKIAHHAVPILTNTLENTTIHIQINNQETRLSAIYKRPANRLALSDIDSLLDTDLPTILAGDLNAKHPFWNSRRTNSAGLLLQDHMVNNNYIIVAPDTPTHYPDQHNHQPDDLATKNSNYFNLFNITKFTSFYSMKLISNPLLYSNYHIYRNDRPTPPGQSGAGGTAILIANKIAHHAVPILTNTLENTTIHIQINNQETRLSAIYKRPANRLALSDIDSPLDTDLPTILAGDLNAKHPFWNSRRTNSAGLLLQDHMVNNNYIIVAPDTPTHYPDQHNTTPNLTNNLQYQLCNYSDELSSDHCPVIMSLRGKPSADPPTNRKTITNWPRFAVDLHLAIPNPNPIINSKAQLDQEVKKLTSTVQNALLNNTSNLSTLTNHQILPDSIHEELTIKRRLRRAWQRTRNPEAKHRFNTQASKVKRLIKLHRESKWDLFLANLKPNDPHIFKINKSLINKRPPNHALYGQSGPVFDSPGKSELFAFNLASQFK